MTHSQTQGADGAGTKTAGQTAFSAFYDDPEAKGWPNISQGGRERWERVAAAVLAAPRADSAERTAGAMILLPLDDPKRPLNDSGLPSVMIWAGGEAYDGLTADKALDLDSCSLAVGIYRAMTEAHAREIATLSPAPAATPGVPDSVREAFEAAKLQELFVDGDKADVYTKPHGSNFINEFEMVARCSCGDLWKKRATAIARTLNWVGALISAQPAGQAGDAGAADKRPLRMRLADSILNGVRMGQEGAFTNLNKTLDDVLALTAPDSTRTGAAETEDALASAIEERWTALIGPAYEGGWVGWKRRDLCREFAKAALAARPEAPSDAGWRERVRHVKRGTEYDVLHRGVSLQVALDRLLPNGREWSKALIEGDRLVIYQGKDGKLWAREESEFDDGRFVSAPVSDPAPSGQAEG